ncbi:MAG: D-hexose-6-phosphate mutarotase, partial [Kiritimatiellales bacterium]
MNQEILIPERVTVKTGKGGLRYLELLCNGAETHVYLHGAHVLHYQPVGQAPVLWTSQKSCFEATKPIRGGIPVCWPWFGAHPSDTTQPAHGSARLTEWEPVASGATANATTLTLRCPNSHEVKATAELTVVLADSLTVTLTTTNTGSAPLSFSEALHTYFSISDIRTVSVTGLDGQPYIDAVPDERLIRTQAGPITFTEETDRIYTNTASECTIIDPGMKRRILVSKKGSRSTVVWNPWVAKATRMPDYGNDEYPKMVCVETANCGPDALNLAPDQTHA